MPHVLAKDLRNAVLQAAVQGKLTKHLTTDCDINEYYSLIKSEKKSVTRKEKELIPTGEEPFDIPDYWMWTFLDELVAKEIRRGKSPKYAKSGKAMAFAQKCNSKYTGIRLDLALCLDDDSLSRYSAVDAMTDKDIVINSTGGGTLGRVGLFEERFNTTHKMYFPDSHVTVIRSKKCVNPIYLLRCLQFLSPYIETLGEGSTNQTELKPDTVRGLYIPLPPIEEQARIVARVDELMAKIDEYEKIEKELVELQKAFPGNMKDSILQAAMQGKLTEQLESDGAAIDLIRDICNKKDQLIKEKVIKKEKPLSVISDEEIPFDLPGNWEWVRLGTLCTRIVDGDHNPPAGINKPTEYRMLSALNINDNRLVELDKCRYLTADVFKKENQRTDLQVNDILFTIVGTLGRTCVYKGGYNLTFQRSVSIIRTLIYPEFLKLLLIMFLRTTH